MMFYKKFISVLLVALMGSCSSSSDPTPEKINLEDILPHELLTANGKSISREMLRGKYIGLYFSASWCPPCRAFTPKLIEFRNERPTQFEVILVGSDRSPEKQQAYVTDHKMPWVALPNQSEHANKLKALFGISGIPALIVISPQGDVVTTQGRDEVANQYSTAFDGWVSKNEGS